jgi:hypothetical protein
MKNKLTMKVAMAVAGLVSASLLPAFGTMTMTLSDGIPADTVSITDNGSGDILNGVTGAIEWTGTIGVWDINVDTGESKPVIGSATQPMLSLVTSDHSTGAGTLTITITDTGFGPVTPDTSSFALNTAVTSIGGTVFGQAIVNGSTATSANISTVGSLTTFGSASGLNTSPWSMSEVITLSNTGSGQDNASETLAVPEPTTMVAGAMLLLPFGASTLRGLRRKIAV